VDAKRALTDNEEQGWRDTGMAHFNELVKTTIVLVIGWACIPTLHEGPMPFAFRHSRTWVGDATADVPAEMSATAV